MDHEITEAMDLGIVMLLAAFFALVTFFICRIGRQSYIERSNEISYLNEVSDSFVWEDLHCGKGMDVEIPGLVTKSFDGCTWARVLYQDISGNTNYFTTSDCLNVNQPGKFSCLQYLEQFRGEDGKFEFMLDYPDVGGVFTGAYNRWKQSTNPVTEQRTNGGPRTNANAVGYEPIHVDMPGYSGQGLEWNGSACVLDGTVSFGNWWLCCGILNGPYASTATPTKPYTMPGPHNGTNSAGNSIVELWVKMDNVAGISIDNLMKWIRTYQDNYQYCILTRNIGNTAKYDVYSNMILSATEKTKLTQQYKAVNIYDKCTYDTIYDNVMAAQMQLSVKNNSLLTNRAKPVVYRNRVVFGQLLSGLTGNTLAEAKGNDAVASDYVLSSHNVVVFVLE